MRRSGEPIGVTEGVIKVSVAVVVVSPPVV